MSQPQDQNVIHEVPIRFSQEAFTDLEYLRTLVVKNDRTQLSRGEIIALSLGLLRQYAEEKLAGNMTCFMSTESENEKEGGGVRELLLPDDVVIANFSES